MTNPDVELVWDYVERARAGQPDPELDGDPEAITEAILEQLEAALADAEPDQLVRFDRGLARLFERSYTWALWGAAYLINGGCSDDGFDYFRGWLVVQGRAVFEAALAEPDSLAALFADADAGEVECEDLLSLTYTLYEERTGEELPIERIELPALGEGWDFDDRAQMAARYPRLWAVFGWGD